MEKEEKGKEKEEKEILDQEAGEADAIELVLFQVSECYVYLIPPRKKCCFLQVFSQLLKQDMQADEWDVNKWAWEGTLKVISKDEECIIRLEDKTTGELYARAFLRNGEPHPVEPVIDSSRYFVLRIEENIDGRLRHAFIGIGFRERTQAYDFQAALHDHMKYLDKKKTAEEMEQNFQNSSSVDYSLKEGETLVLQIKTKGGTGVKPKITEQGLSNLSLEEKGERKEPLLSIPPPPSPMSPVSPAKTSPSSLPPKMSLDGTSKDDSPRLTKEDTEEQHSPEKESTQDIPDDDFGDFQAAG